MINKETKKFLTYLDEEYRIFGPPSILRSHDDARYLFEEISKPRK